MATTAPATIFAPHETGMAEELNQIRHYLIGMNLFNRELVKIPGVSLFGSSSLSSHSILGQYEFVITDVMVERSAYSHELRILPYLRPTTKSTMAQTRIAGVLLPKVSCLLEYFEPSGITETVIEQSLANACNAVSAEERLQAEFTSGISGMPKTNPFKPKPGPVLFKPTPASTEQPNPAWGTW